MKICFVSITGADVSGLIRYTYELHSGLKSVSDAESEYIFLSRGKKIADTFKYAGIHDGEYRIIGNVDDAIEALNSYDWIIFDKPCGTNDISYARNNVNKKPWFYDIISNITTNCTALLLDAWGYGKYSPYIELWEDKCNIFIAIKEMLTRKYMDDRDVIDCHTLNTPIDTSSVMDTLSNIDTIIENNRHLICNTARIVATKMHVYLINAMHSLPEWDAEIHSGMGFYHHKQVLVELSAKLDNVDLYLDEIDFNLDDIYRHAAIVFNATKFPDGEQGGAEYSTMEGILRGCVPLTINDWVSPWPGALPRDYCYVFDYQKKGVSNIDDVLSNVDIYDWEYKYKLEGSLNYLVDVHDRVMLANRLVSILGES